MISPLIQIKPFHQDPDIHAATQRGLEITKAADVLVVCDPDVSAETRDDILEFLGNKDAYQEGCDIYKIHSNERTLPALVALFMDKAYYDIPVVADISAVFRRLSINGEEISTRHLVVVGSIGTQQLFP